MASNQHRQKQHNNHFTKRTFQEHFCLFVGVKREEKNVQPSIRHSRKDIQMMWFFFRYLRQPRSSLNSTSSADFYVPTLDFKVLSFSSSFLLFVRLWSEPLFFPLDVSVLQHWHFSIIRYHSKTVSMFMQTLFWWNHFSGKM